MGLNKTVHILPLPHIKRPVSFDSLTFPRNNGMNVKSLLLCLIVEPVKDSISNLAVFLAGWRCAYPAYIEQRYQLIARLIVGPCKRSAAGRNSQNARSQQSDALTRPSSSATAV